MHNIEALNLFNILFYNHFYLDSNIFYNFLFKNGFLLLPEMILISGIFFYLCFIKNLKSFYIQSFYFYFILILELFFTAYNLFFVFYSTDFISQLFFYSCFTADLYSFFCKFFIIFFLILIVIFAELKFVWDKPTSADIYIPIFFFVFFSLFLLSAFDLFGAYLALEGVSLSLYALTANTYHKRVAVEASIKYFVFGGISNGLLLFGNSIIFGLCGSLNYIEIKYLFNSLKFNLSSSEVCLSLVCFVIVFLFKIAGFPCHMWSPDVYEGVWLPITTILIVLVKLLYFFFFFKLFFYVFIKVMYLWQPLFLLSSFGSLVIGSFGIIGQNRIKRLMAYSSINHVSFLLLGMACGNLTGLCITILYLLVYSLTLLIFFGFVLNARCLLTARPLIYLSDFAKLAQFSTWGSQGLLIILFSMGGLPPLAGFFVKFYIYIEAISSSFYIFVFFSLVISIISTFYYLFFLKSILFDKNLWSKLICIEFLRTASIYIIFISCLFLIGFSFVNSFIYNFIFIVSASLICPYFFIFL